MPLRFNIPSLLAADSPQPLDPARLKKFVDSLPIPRVLRPKRIAKGIPQCEVTMTAFRQKLHRGLPPTYLWGYNHTYPGPTFEAGTGQPISVKWINHLPTRHFLPVDTNIHGADMGAPAVRAVVRLHGGHVPPKATAILNRGSRRETRPPIFTPTINRPCRCGTTITHWDHPPQCVRGTGRIVPDSR